jgi:ribose 1,5-bisphosphate isomerase
VAALRLAKRQGKKFAVHVTETRPMLQGRITATELASAKIPVTIFADSAGRLALKKADIALLGADAITSEGKVINKIGSELLALVAEKLDVPLYICSDSWKFDPKSVFGFERELETRSQKEIWNRPPKGISISNFVFEKIDASLITGIISELGVCKPESLVHDIKITYPWMFY